MISTRRKKRSENNGKNKNWFGPPNPPQALKNAKLIELQSISRLARSRRNKSTAHIVDKIHNQWRGARSKYKIFDHRGGPNYTIIRDADKNLNRYFLNLINKLTEPWGNEETTRVKSSRGQSIGRLNQLHNNLRFLREYGEILYPFPSLWEYDYTLPDGEEIHPKHTGLISLEFMDMVRPHLRMFNKVLFNANVPLKIARKWQHRLFWELTPFLDWIYGGGGQGKNSRKSSPKLVSKQFGEIADMDKILNKFTDQINAYYNYGPLPRKLNEIRLEDRF